MKGWGSMPDSSPPNGRGEGEQQLWLSQLAAWLRYRWSRDDEPAFAACSVMRAGAEIAKPRERMVPTSIRTSLGIWRSAMHVE